MRNSAEPTVVTSTAAQPTIPLHGSLRPSASKKRGPGNARRNETVAALPGYTRGLDLHDGLAFVGLSRIREKKVFGGLPLDERRDSLKTGVEEIFEVRVLPGYGNPVVSGAIPTWPRPRPSGLCQRRQNPLDRDHRNGGGRHRNAAVCVAPPFLRQTACLRGLLVPGTLWESGSAP